jgi:hypothetical protein
LFRAFKTNSLLFLALLGTDGVYYPVKPHFIGVNIAPRVWYG